MLYMYVEYHIVGDRLKPRNSVFSRFSDLYTFEYLIYLYNFCGNLGTLGKIFVGEIGVRNN